MLEFRSIKTKLLRVNRQYLFAENHGKLKKILHDERKVARKCGGVH
jgi:hypothetical protein